MNTYLIFGVLASAAALSLSSCITIESHEKPATSTVTRETVTPNGPQVSQTTETTYHR